MAAMKDSSSDGSRRDFNVQHIEKASSSRAASIADFSRLCCNPPKSRVLHLPTYSFRFICLDVHFGKMISDMRLKVERKANWNACMKRQSSPDIGVI